MDHDIVNECLQTYELGSGAKVNWSKTELLPLGKSNLNNLETSFRKLDNDASIRHLGVQVGQNVDITRIWNNHRDNLLVTCNILRQHSLSILERARAVQTYLISSITYTMRFVPLPNNHLEELNKIIQNYILGKTRAPISQEILTLPHSNGGIQLPQLEHIRDNLDLKFLRNALRDNAPWAPLLRQCIDHCYGKPGLGLDIFKNSALPSVNTSENALKHSPQTVSTTSSSTTTPDPRSTPRTKHFR